MKATLPSVVTTVEFKFNYLDDQTVAKGASVVTTVEFKLVWAIIFSMIGAFFSRYYSRI